MRNTYTNLCLTALTLILAASCSSPHLYPRQQATREYTIEQTQPVDSGLVRLIRPYKRGVDTQMQVVLGHTDVPLTKAQPESTLGNFIADAQLMAARAIDPKTDISISNYGGIRLPYIDPGVLTRGKVYELMPFDNMLTIIELPGTGVKQFCDYMAKRKGWPVSGIQFVIRDTLATDIRINGAPLDEHRFYKLATSDYVARGGDNCDFLSTYKKRFTSVFIRDALMTYITQLEREGKPLHPQIENRIRYAE